MLQTFSEIYTFSQIHGNLAGNCREMCDQTDRWALLSLRLLPSLAQKDHAPARCKK